ncbi:MAG: hypothetical protein KAR40_14450 [Candidatus Sabulitectum sp.]|nr:hypothetical protein [Candidatus Sabulitectum sp.]
MMFGSKDQKDTNQMFGEMGMPGPAMAARMMQMMPMMAGGMLSEMSGENRKDYLLEMVGKLVARSTADITDEEYSSLIDELTESLRERKPAQDESPQGCC